MDGQGYKYILYPPLISSLLNFPPEPAPDHKHLGLRQRQEIDIQESKVIFFGMQYPILPWSDAIPDHVRLIDCSYSCSRTYPDNDGRNPSSLPPRTAVLRF